MEKDLCLQVLFVYAIMVKIILEATNGNNYCIV